VLLACIPLSVPVLVALQIAPFPVAVIVTVAAWAGVAYAVRGWVLACVETARALRDRG
jgi:hypothetical protein